MPASGRSQPDRRTGRRKAEVFGAERFHACVPALVGWADTQRLACPASLRSSDVKPPTGTKHWATWAAIMQLRICYPDPRAIWARLCHMGETLTVSGQPPSEPRDRPFHIQSRRAVSFDQADRASLW